MTVSFARLRFSFSSIDPGLILSFGAHALLLILMLVLFSNAPSFQEAQESIPVEIITEQATPGSKIEEAKAEIPKIEPNMPVSSRMEEKPDIPVPAPLPIESHLSPPLPPVAPPPSPAPPVIAPPVPLAPVPLARPPSPVEKKSEETEASVQQPPIPQPTFRPKEHPPVSPLTHPEIPPKREEPKRQETLKPDPLAKLLEAQTQEEKKPLKSSKAEKEAPARHRFDPSEVGQLLARDESLSKSSSASQVKASASTGSSTTSTARMSPSLWGQLDELIVKQYKECWRNPPGTGEQDYIPQIEAYFMPDGRLGKSPVLKNPPTDPVLQSYAERALRAVRQCSPLKIPADYAPYYEEWKTRVIRFNMQN